MIKGYKGLKLVNPSVNRSLVDFRKDGFTIVRKAHTTGSVFVSRAIPVVVGTYVKVSGYFKFDADAVSGECKVAFDLKSVLGTQDTEYQYGDATVVSDAGWQYVELLCSIDHTSLSTLDLNSDSLYLNLALGLFGDVFGELSVRGLSIEVKHPHALEFSTAFKVGSTLNLGDDTYELNQVIHVFMEDLGNGIIVDCKSGDVLLNKHDGRGAIAVGAKKTLNFPLSPYDTPVLTIGAGKVTDITLERAVWGY